MSKRFDVVQAVKSMIQLALPSAEVIGLENDAAIPQRPAPGGRIIVRSGDIGEPDVDLSPLAYNYEHAIPIELTAWPSGGEAALDTMMSAIGTQIEANRTLSGLIDWLEAQSPLSDDIYFEGAPPQDRGNFDIVATYATSNPLT